MACLESTFYDQSKEDLTNNKRRYKVTFLQSINRIGFDANRRTIISVHSDIARNNFIPNSSIIQINDTSLNDDTSNTTIKELMTYNKSNPGSFLILQCNNDMFQKGVHFQLNLKFIVQNPTEIHFKHITRANIERIMSYICPSKEVEVYDIAWGQNDDVLIFGFIFDTSYSSQHVLNNIQNELHPYNRLTQEIINMFTITLTPAEISTKSTCFEWDLTQIHSLSHCFDKSGLVGSQLNVMEMFWNAHILHIKDVCSLNSKAAVLKLVEFTMDCFVMWKFQDDDDITVYTLKYSRDLWIDMLTNWLFENIVNKQKLLTCDDFNDNYSLYLLQFYTQMKQQYVHNLDRNSNFVVYRYIDKYIEEHNIMIPNEISNLIKIYYCDIPLQISLQQTLCGYRYNQLNSGYGIYSSKASLDQIISISELVYVVTTKSDSWVAILTTPHSQRKFIDYRSLGVAGQISDLQKNLGIIIANGKVEIVDGIKRIPMKDFEELKHNFMLRGEPSYW